MLPIFAVVLTSKKADANFRVQCSGSMSENDPEFVYRIVGCREGRRYKYQNGRHKYGNDSHISLLLLSKRTDAAATHPSVTLICYHTRLTQALVDCAAAIVHQHASSPQQPSRAAGWLTAMRSPSSFAIGHESRSQRSISAD